MCHFKQNYTARMEDSDQSGTVVAVCQMNSTNEVERNLEICEDLIRKAKTRGAKGIYHLSKVAGQISQFANGMRQFCWTERAAYD